MKKLNLGCGRDLQREIGIDWVNLDRSPNVGADLVCDFTCIEDWQFSENEFDEVLAYNSLTQIASNRAFVDVMNHLHHITKKGGVVKVRVPDAMKACAWQDPMDCRRFTRESFSYLDVEHRRYEQY